MSRVQQLLTGGFSQETTSRIKSKSIKKGTGRSGADVLDKEPNRIERYIKDKYKDTIYNKKTAKLAVDSLLFDSTKGQVGNSDFSNLLGNAGGGKEGFAEWLFDKYGKRNVDKILNSEVKLKSKKVISGYKANELVYLRQTKAGLRAYSFATNRFVKLPKNLPFGE